MSHLPEPRRRWPVALGVVSTLLLVGVGVVAGTWTDTRSQWIRDRWVVWTQPSPPEIEAIADATGMSEEGRLVYLASTPEIEAGEDFAQHCAVETGIVLGCYVREEIFLFEVLDDRLAGTIEVTAAHEMLHAAYDRLSPEEREHVDALVASAVELLPADDRVFEEIALYEQRQLPGEWHSRLGTEFATLPPELEAYYTRWFDDRAKVVALHERSRAVLEQLEAEIEARVAELDALDADLEARIAGHRAATAALEADILAFNARADAGDFSSQAQFDRERAALVERSERLDQEATAINADIDRFNTLAEELTALDADYADLYESLDPFAPPPGIDG